MQATVHYIAVGAIFVACALMIFAGSGNAPANEIMQLLILAGVVVNFLDGQARTRQTSQQIAENTALTAKTQHQINGAAEERIRAASTAAYAQGFLHGSNAERERGAKIDTSTLKGSSNGKANPAK
jgi:hypothetical protein